MDEEGRARARRGHNKAMLDAAYEKYAAQLYDYCLWFAAGDTETAESAVHSALVAAYGREGLLRDDGPLRPWLYGAARNECLRAAHRSPRPAGAKAAFGAVEDPTAKITAVEELARVRRVTATFTRHEQDVAELALRHRLVPPEVALVLGRPESHIRTAILRVHSTLSARCGEGVLLAFASPPPPPLPESLYARIRGSALIPDRAAYFAERAAPYTRAGYPVPLDRPRPRARTVALVSAVSGLAVLALVAVVAQAGAPPDNNSGPDRPPLVVGTELGPGQTDIATGEPNPAPSATLPTADVPAPTTAPPPPGTGVTPKVRLQFRSSGGCPATWTAVITAIVEDNVAREVKIAWWTSSRPEQEITAAPTAENNYLTSISGLPYGTEVFFRATAVTVDGRSAQTGAYPVTAHCR
jgi:DNA-directed RNA polymerase specialized sigma24 family protein